MVCFEGLVTVATGTAIEFRLEFCWLSDPGKFAVDPFTLLPVMIEDD